MARGGKRPKPAYLRLVDGTHTPSRHGDRTKAGEAVERAVASFGKLGKPEGLLGDHARAAWKRWVEPAYWLDGSRGAAAVAFCNLWHEFREAPRVFPAAKHGQMRAYMNDLGLTDERNRSDSEPPKDEFFDD